MWWRRVAGLTLAGAALCVLPILVACSADDGPASVVRSFLAGWPTGKVDAVGFVDAGGDPVAGSVVSAQLRTLAGELDLSRLSVSAAGDPTVNGTDATASVDVAWRLTPASPGHGAVVWHYQTVVHLLGGQDTWRVVWSAQTLHPALRLGDSLTLHTTAAHRGQVTDATGAPLSPGAASALIGALTSQFDGVLRGADQVVVSAGGHTLFSTTEESGSDVGTTLSAPVQAAADRALTDLTVPAAIVAVRVDDGHILAVANAGGVANHAFVAAVPPGNVFGLVTTLAVAAGIGPDAVVTCPKTYTVDNRTFSTDTDLGAPPLHTDLAKTCTTAFAILGGDVPSVQLNQTASALGLGGAWDLGTATFTGMVPVVSTAADRASVASGSGPVQVSPLALAAAAAAADRGSWIPPVLLTARPAAAHSVPTLPPAAYDAVRPMLREGVTAGSASGLATVPGGPVYAVAGVASYGDSPTPEHGWVVGWQGNLAFAVWIQTGVGGANVAVPVAATFLAGIGGGT
jgi:hypothetical protein